MVQPLLFRRGFFASGKEVSSGCITDAWEMTTMLGLMILSAAAAKAALFMYFNRQLAEGYARQKAAIERRQKQQATCLRAFTVQKPQQTGP